MPGNREPAAAANELLDRFGVEQPPIPVEQIATGLGARVSFEAFSRDVSGILFRDGSNIVIAVNASHSPTRNRFTIAHELGHLTLHEGNQVFVDRSTRIDRRDDVAAKGIDPTEIQANGFAAALLMPADMLMTSLDEAPDLPVRELIDWLARRFNVSKPAMSNRLSNLGLSLGS